RRIRATARVKGRRGSRAWRPVPRFLAAPTAAFPPGAACAARANSAAASFMIASLNAEALPMAETRKIAAILVADVVGYSRLAGADEEGTLARLRALRGDLIDPA